MLEVIAGPDARDPTSLRAEPVEYSAILGKGIGGLRVAWSPGLNGAIAEPDVLAVAETAAGRFAELGAHVEEADPGVAAMHDLYRTLFAAEAAGALGERLGEWRGRMDPGLVTVVEMGLRVSAAEYARARNEVYRRGETICRFFERYDLMLTPTLPVPPFPVRVSWPRQIAGQKVHPLAFLAYTYPFNLTGQPAASVPCGWTGDGLPVGLQIVGRRFDEGTVLQAAAAFEAAFPWAHRHPCL